jgi:hypothetical protein
VKYELGSYIPEDDILHSHSRENLKSYIIVLIIVASEHANFLSERFGSKSMKGIPKHVERYPGAFLLLTVPPGNTLLHRGCPYRTDTAASGLTTSLLAKYAKLIGRITLLTTQKIS